MVEPQIELPREALQAFCRRWKITEFSLFGSVLRDDFGPDSDIDVLVEYARPPQWSLLDHVRAQQELEQIFGRPVDLLTRRGVEQGRNWVRKKLILSTAQPIALA